MSRKYLVAGAAGFIAAKVCEQILDQGDQVVGVDQVAELDLIVEHSAELAEREQEQQDSETVRFR